MATISRDTAFNSATIRIVRAGYADAEPKERTSVLLGLMNEANRERLMHEAALSWKRAIRRWEHSGEVVLLEEVACVLTDAVCTWAGLPLKQAKVRRLARNLVRMVDGSAGLGPRRWHAELARARTEIWVAYILGKIRRRTLQVHRDSALYVLANHRELDLQTAAAELVDFLQPIVAVAWDVTLAARVLQESPHLREEIIRDQLCESAEVYADALTARVSHFGFIPQQKRGHWITRLNVASALHFLTSCCTYEVVTGADPAQQVTTDLVVRNVRATEALDRSAPRLSSESPARDVGQWAAQAVPGSLTHH
jgi:hypothetical protein